MGVSPDIKVFATAALRGKTENREWAYICKSGACLTVSLSVTAMRNEEGLLTGFIGRARDFSASTGGS